MSHITLFIVQWNPINTVTNGPETFGQNNRVTCINEVAIRWGSTVPYLPANTAVIQLSLLASDGLQANRI